MTALRITTGVDGHGIAILGVAGELVTDAAGQLTAAAAAVLTRHRVTQLVVDLVRVARLDMNALHTPTAGTRRCSTSRRHIPSHPPSAPSAAGPASHRHLPAAHRRAVVRRPDLSKLGRGNPKERRSWGSRGCRSSWTAQHSPAAPIRLRTGEAPRDRRQARRPVRPGVGRADQESNRR